MTAAEDIVESEVEDNVEPEPSGSTVKSKKSPKRGIIYLSTIPPYMNVSKIREVFSEFGTVGRVYLQLAEPDPKPGEKKKRKKVARKFTEGWVEFEKKSVAKKVAAHLNNQQVDSRKRSKQFDSIWNIKYLSNFKWPHLHERLAYEKAARRQKLRAEITLAKKKTNFFTSNLDKKKKAKQLVNKETEGVKKTEKMDTEEAPEEDREEFLQSLFT
ncbi:unnamed protein product [Brassicogethes aeneus]|uniref:Activator of basal transcription 1 n=1 Tax=Brassicogethes aeneus TaxID=1431903 RepID=A0A9P0FKA0_BRAAE|nr:unnamed protein product [Brassicogethes aeneus]